MEGSRFLSPEDYQSVSSASTFCKREPMYQMIGLTLECMKDSLQDIQSLSAIYATS